MTSRLGLALRQSGASCRGKMCWIASVCFCTAENCWAQSSTVSPNSPAWETRASRKLTLSTSLLSARLSHRRRSWTTSVDIAFTRDCAVMRGQSTSAVPASTSGWYYPRAFKCLGLVYLQDSHGMQRRGGLARSTVSFGRENGRQFTGFGWETRTIPPSAPQPHSPPGECERTP